MKEKTRISGAELRREALKWVVDLLLIVAGAAVYSVAVNVFTSPNNIAPGGVTGISIILSSLTDVPVGRLIALINVPLLIAGFIFLNKRTMIKTLFAVAVLSIMTDTVFADIAPYLAKEGSGILAAIFGGLLMGVGQGLNYMRESTTGGTDIVIKIILRFRPQMRLGQLSMIVNACVVAAGYIVYRDLDVVMYALIAIFVEARVVDMLVYGGHECKFLMIFSDKYSEIAEKLLEEDIGVTLLNGEGAYSGRERRVLAIAVRKGDYVRVRRTIRDTDPAAFVVITGASEVLGKGFQKLE